VIPAESAEISAISPRPTMVERKDEAKPSDSDDEPKRGEVVTLDAFRKK
jgi:uncharacterized protein